MQELFFQSAEHLGRSRVLLESGDRCRITAGADLELDDQGKRRLKAILAGIASLSLPNRSAWIELSDERATSTSDLYPFQVSPNDVTYPDWPLLSGAISSAWDQNPPWDARQPFSYWRGRLAGEASTIKEVMGLLRLQLAVAAKFNFRVDAKLTGLGRFEVLGQPLSDSLEGLGLIAKRETDGPLPRYCIDVEGDLSDRALSAFHMGGACPIRLGGPYKTWADIRLDGVCQIPSVPYARDIGDTVLRLEVSGEGRQLFHAVQECMRAITAETAWVGFRDALEQIA